MWFGMPLCLGKIGTAASQAITLYYFQQSQPELASARFNYCADTQRLRIYEARSFHRSRSFSFFQSAEAARSKPGARMNDERMCS